MKNTIRSFFFCCLFCLPIIVFAQEKIPEKHEFSITIGLGYGQVKEKLVSRQIYSGLQIPLKLNYRFYNQPSESGKLSFFQGGLEGFFSQPQSPYKDKALFIGFGGNVGFYKQAFSNNNKQNNHFYWGGQIKYSTTIDYFTDVRAEYFYWLTHYSLHPSLIWERKTDGSLQLFVKLDLPLLGLASRPPTERFTNAEDSFGFILKESHQNLQFFLPNTFRAIDLETGIDFLIKDKWQQRLSYHFTFKNFIEPASIAIVQHQLRLTTIF